MADQLPTAPPARRIPTSVRVSGLEAVRRRAPGRLPVDGRGSLPGAAADSSRRGQLRWGQPLGQGLAEFALVLPIVLIVVVGALDLGRAFYTWVTVTNGARVGAAYAALHPVASFGPGSDYDALVRGEGIGSLGGICPLTGGAIPTPSFADGNGDGNDRSLGDWATVRLTCTFRILTPVLAQVVGGQVAVSASSTFPIRTGP